MSNKRLPALKTHDEIVAVRMEGPAFSSEYNALNEEYQLSNEMLHARKRFGLTQEDVAERMGTKAPAIATLEASGARDKY